jgi:hypothetical protein
MQALCFSALFIAVGRILNPGWLFYGLLMVYALLTLLELRGFSRAGGRYRCLLSKIMDVQQRLRTEMLNAQREIQDLEALLLKKQTEDIRAKIATLAGNEGVELVVDRNAVLFNAKGIDLTDKVLTSMGVDPAKAINPREAEKNEGK